MCSVAVSLHFRSEMDLHSRQPKDTAQVKLKTNRSPYDLSSLPNQSLWTREPSSAPISGP